MSLTGSAPNEQLKAEKYLWRVAGLLGLVIVGVACVRSVEGPLNVDFTMFWNMRGLAYPPPYLLIIKPFTVLPYGVAFTLWLFFTGALYFLASGSAKLHAIANPAATFNGMIGQNGFLVGAIMFAGLRKLAESPVLGGAILGFLVIKPHLGAVLPIAVIAAKAWKAIPAALGTATALLGLAFITFGAKSYVTFFDLSLKYSGYVGGGVWDWNELASFYALGRWIGINIAAAWSLHAIFAASAAIFVWFAWSRDWEGKIPLTASAALLISPYQFTYDAVLLTLALGSLNAPKAVAVWCLLAIPLARVFINHDLPNTVPLAAALAVSAIAWEQRRRTAIHSHP